MGTIDFDNLPNTCAVIDKQAFSHNINSMWDHVGRNRKMLVAVKADAYGHGAVPISELCETLGVSWLGVALADEGISLRKAGITSPILKFSPIFENELAGVLKYKISFVICSFEEFSFIEKIIIQNNMDQRADVHLKIDTGMGRVGIAADDSIRLCKKLIQSPVFNLQGIMTHLPVSDSSEPENIAYTRKQLKLFKTITDQMLSMDQQGSKTLPLVHAANSGGILAHPDSWFDMVRPGISAYGTYPSKEVKQTVALKEVMTFKSRVSFVKNVSAGTGISYGHIWKAPENTKIATVPVGYADGYNRLLSNRGKVIINNRIYPVAGRVCMDQIMINLGPCSNVKRGDHVILFGPACGPAYGSAPGSASQECRVSQQFVADQLDTITYEITCRIDKRVPRVYV
jgi:alanine racemase